MKNTTALFLGTLLTTQAFGASKSGDFFVEEEKSNSAGGAMSSYTLSTVLDQSSFIEMMNQLPEDTIDPVTCSISPIKERILRALHENNLTSNNTGTFQKISKLFKGLIKVTAENQTSLTAIQPLLDKLQRSKEDCDANEAGMREAMIIEHYSQFQMDSSIQQWRNGEAEQALGRERDSLNIAANQALASIRSIQDQIETALQTIEEITSREIKEKEAAIREEQIRKQREETLTKARLDQEIKQRIAAETRLAKQEEERLTLLKRQQEYEENQARLREEEERRSAEIEKENKRLADLKTAEDARILRELKITALQNKGAEQIENRKKQNIDSFLTSIRTKTAQLKSARIQREIEAQQLEHERVQKEEMKKARLSYLMSKMKAFAEFKGKEKVSELKQQRKEAGRRLIEEMKAAEISRGEHLGAYTSVAKAGGGKTITSSLDTTVQLTKEERDARKDEARLERELVELNLKAAAEERKSISYGGVEWDDVELQLSPSKTKDQNLAAQLRAIIETHLERNNSLTGVKLRALKNDVLGLVTGATYNKLDAFKTKNKIN